MSIEEIASREKTVLIADDDKDFLGFWRCILKEAGSYKVTLAESPEEVRWHVPDHYDVFICDGFNGECFPLCKKISADISIIYSGNLLIINEAKKRGIECYDKPNETKKLIERLKSL